MNKKKKITKNIYEETKMKRINRYVVFPIRQNL